MKTITVITRHPDAAVEYFGFGCRETERGKTKFGDHALIATCPDGHVDWNVARLSSGLHGACAVDNLEAWKEEWGYVSEDD